MGFKYQEKNIILKSCVILLILLTLSECGLNPVLLETRANDPIMMNLLDNDIDLAQIEDGTGFAGDAASCPT